MAYKKIRIPDRIVHFVTLRDKGICQSCGEKGVIKRWMNCYSRAYIHGSAMEISHIVPEFLGGKTITENLVLMCRFCNRSLGVKIWKKT